MATQRLSIAALREGYRNGQLNARTVIEDVLARVDSAPQENVWITRLPRDAVLEYVAAIEKKPATDLPLYGVPFAIKDNIDLAGVPTTAGCKEYAYVPNRSATVVQKLIDAGAIPIGKTNLDQFATGLVGVRSPYGACSNSFDPEFISGGSSSGSAVVVATGLVSFALGTDTAGSGRVPAGFNNIVGLKPSCGLLSTQGVVPACRSLDAVSIFALTSADAEDVLDSAQGFDAADAYSKELSLRPASTHALRVGIPPADQLEFFGDAEYQAQFASACERMIALGATAVTIDVGSFLETACLLYEGPWVAERYAAIASFIERQPEALHPVTRQIIGSAADLKAIDAFRSQYKLRELQRITSAVWRDIDVMLLPTAPTIYRIADVEAEPIRLNSNLGLYTNFVNLLDLAAVAVPSGFRIDGMPFGVTLIAPSGEDPLLLAWAARLHHASVSTMGALECSVPAPTLRTTVTNEIPVVVCGAHMSGLPLNHQLSDRGARLLRATETAAKYRFYALPGGPPKRPGLVRVASGGAAIVVEVWSVPPEHFGSFVAGIPAPLGIGKVELADGSLCPGFICETYAAEGAQEITELRSWREYLKGR
ncbi:MAG TPA: allophanate hydrolase [Steroidobacteraceae bacterium]|nr:allophanate hydrolase [Steroidobacteraceae bacterium]